MILLQKTRRAEARKEQKRLDRLKWWFTTCAMWLVIAIVISVLLIVVMLLTSGQAG